MTALNCLNEVANRRGSLRLLKGFKTALNTIFCLINRILRKNISVHEVIYVDASSNLATSTYNKHMGVIWIRGIEEVNALSTIM